MFETELVHEFVKQKFGVGQGGVRIQLLPGSHFGASINLELLLRRTSGKASEMSKAWGI